MKLQRKVLVTIGVVVIGAAIGSLAGVAFAGIAFATSHYRSAQLAMELFKLGTQVGASVGVVLGPLAAFTMLRRVPLGRFLWHSVIGASTGAIVGIVLQRLDSAPGHSLAPILAMSVGGFALAAGHLWWRFRDRASRMVGVAG